MEKLYTIDYIESLPDGKRSELIDGIIYNMATPTILHQEIVHQLDMQIGTAIKSNNGKCKVYPAPFSVHLEKLESIKI